MVDPKHKFPGISVENDFGSKIDAFRSGAIRKDIGNECPIFQIWTGVQIDGMIRSKSAMPEFEVNSGTIVGRNNTRFKRTVGVAHTVPIIRIVVFEYIAIVYVH